MTSPRPKRIESRVEQAADNGVRLDVYVSERLGLFSRSQARTRIVAATVNGNPARLAKKLQLGDVVGVEWTDPPQSELTPEDIALDVLFENDDVAVIDKPQGMVVHPGSGNAGGTLVHALLFRYAGLAGAFGKTNGRPGIVHRLDKETSGIIIVARNVAAHEMLAEQFRDRTTRKRYLAIVQGSPGNGEGRIDSRLARDPHDRKRFACVAIGGRTASTRYRVLKSFPADRGAYSLVLLAPRTGRTHQLRVHMKALGTPVLGDAVYGRRDPTFPDARLMLHARSLTIRLPGEEQPRTFVSPLPMRFLEIVKRLQSFSPSTGL
jgi:23S rRNA pseudouridine1911/1915/1917 synthase